MNSIMGKPALRIQVDIVNRKAKWFWSDSARTPQEFLDIMNDNPNTPKLKYRLSSDVAKLYHRFWKLNRVYGSNGWIYEM